MAKQFKSEVWQCIDRTNAEACTCRVCMCEVKKPKRDTSNPTRHLERHHQREFQEYNRLTKLREEDDKRQIQQPKLKQTFQPTQVKYADLDLYPVSRSGSKGADRICIWICLKKAGS